MSDVNKETENTIDFSKFNFEVISQNLGELKAEINKLSNNRNDWESIYKKVTTTYKTITAKYSELDKVLPNLEIGTYDLIVDCTNVPASEFSGSSSTESPFGTKLKSTQQNIYFNLSLINLDSTMNNASFMLSGCSCLVSIDTRSLRNIKNATGIFKDCINLVDINTIGLTAVEVADNMFQNCSNLKSLNTECFTKIKSAVSMFDGCSVLSKIDTIGFKNITNAAFMFSNCSNLSSINTIGFTNVINNTSSMFENCINLSNIVWENEFKPTIFNNMFKGISKNIIITVSDKPTKEWINQNKSTMNLINYSLIDDIEIVAAELANTKSILVKTQKELEAKTLELTNMTNNYEASQRDLATTQETLKNTQETLATTQENLTATEESLATMTQNYENERKGRSNDLDKLNTQITNIREKTK